MKAITEEWEVSFHVTGNKADAKRWLKRALAVLDASPPIRIKENDTYAFCSGHVLGRRNENE